MSPSSFESQLFRAARAETPSPASRDRALAAAVLAVESVGPATSVWLLRLRHLALACVVTASVAFVTARSRTPALAPDADLDVAVAREPIAIAPKLTVVPDDPAPSPVASARAVAPVGPVTPAWQPEDDLPRLVRARGRIAAGDPSGALSMLAEVRDRTLAEETEALRIEALVASGERDRARSAFARFQADHPSSPYAHRLGALVR